MIKKNYIKGTNGLMDKFLWINGLKISLLTIEKSIKNEIKAVKLLKIIGE